MKKFLQVASDRIDGSKDALLRAALRSLRSRGDAEFRDEEE